MWLIVEDMILKDLRMGDLGVDPKKTKPCPLILFTKYIKIPDMILPKVKGQTLVLSK